MLPITLAIIQALIVRAGGEQFAIPLTSVEESLRIYSRDIRTVERREVFTLRDFTLPLLRLADAFGLDDDQRSTARTRSGSSSSRAPARRWSASSSTRWCGSRKW